MTLTKTALWILFAAAACGGPAKSAPPPAEPPAPVVAEATPPSPPAPAPAPSPPPQPEEAPPPAPPPAPPEQSKPKPDPACPTIQIKAPDSVPDGTPAKISTTLIGGKGKITFRWTVTSGKITKGQGTANITVDTKGLAGGTVTATVELGRLSKQCETTTGSVSVLVGT